ncbi:MAG: Gfo/Idh/MocA family oxidoreductase [Treponema sp.]|nr:Gfo/Idh/MocA family oxidoreductase [Treponema sp.]
MRAPLRICLVGTGAMAEYHGRRFSALEGVKVVATVDRDRVRAAAFAEKAGIPAIYDDVGQLAASGAADAVAISSRDAGHAEAAIEALSKGLAVFCEKPMARNVPEAEAMVRAASASALPAMVNFSKRNGGLLALSRDLIRSGEIGEVESAEFFYLQDWLHSGCWGDWRTTPRWQWRLDESQSSHGVLGDLASHCVDAMLFIFGSAIPRACVARRFEAPLSAAWRPEVGAELSAEAELSPGAVAFAGAELSARALLDCGECDAALSVSFGARSHIDAFGFRIRGSLGDIIVDTDLSRDELIVLTDEGAEPRRMRGRELPSTYECFAQMAGGGDYVNYDDPSDFANGLRVVRTIEELADLAAHASALKVKAGARR